MILYSETYCILLFTFQRRVIEGTRRLAIIKIRLTREAINFQSHPPPGFKAYFFEPHFLSV
ncbi:hypothetical protein M413DRAFT_234873 [Hebeloma cylindrosporum]|uniref:Uncharacterized protein n=1 Tax=Hebeloma cylindrosporum TaxID=76867 RepID=A0A0C3BQV5_HEBCY|nr:hypothetical protein M413DRAFT_234873 [Hebeloma cylindrosporum h7]